MAHKISDRHKRALQEQIKRDHAADRAVVISAVIFGIVMLIVISMTAHELTDPSHDALACHIEECE